MTIDYTRKSVYIDLKQGRLLYIENLKGISDMFEGALHDHPSWARPKWQAGATITESMEHIRIEGHTGTWYVIDSGKFYNHGFGSAPHYFFLLEHEEYGDEAASLIVDDEGEIILDDVWNGFNDLEDEGWERVDV
jgi:hypothetical protein